MGQQSLYISVCVFTVSVFLCSQITIPVTLSVFLVLLGVTLFIVPLIFRNKNKDAQNKSIFGAIIWLCVLSVLVGLFRVSLWQFTHDVGVLPSFAEQKVMLQGIVVEEPRHTDVSQSIIVAVQSVKQGKETTAIKKERVRATLNRYETVAYGDSVELSGTLKIPQAFVTENGETFDYKKYLARQGVATVMSFGQLVVLEHKKGSRIKMFLYSVKQWFIAQAVETLPYPHSGLFTGLVISGRSGLSETQQDLFTQVGIVHIVALSGTNVTIIVQALLLSLFFVTKRIRLIIGAIGIISFTIMTGAEPTVVRAAIMGLLAISATLLVRTYDIKRALFLAGGGMILYDPMIVFSLSFQLSFLATFALLFVTPLVGIRYGKIVEKIPERFLLREIIVSTVTIELFLVPLIFYSIGETSIIALLSNIFVLPMLPIAMLTGFVAVVIGVVSYALALPIIFLAYLSLGYIFFIAEFFARIPFATVSVSLPWWGMLILYIVLCLWYWRLYIHASPEQQTHTMTLEKMYFITTD